MYVLKVYISLNSVIFTIVQHLLPLCNATTIVQRVLTLLKVLHNGSGHCTGIAFCGLFPRVGFQSIKNLR